MRLSWQQIPSTVISDLLCQNSLDGIVLDTEHGCFNNETLYNCIQLIMAYGKKCFVRLTEINKTLIRFCLDAGANGLIFSTIETEQQAKEIHQLCKFPIFGGTRGLGLVKQNKWGYSKLVSSPPILIAQIETKKAINNIKKIVFYQFDYYMIGPYDLSANLGVPGQFDEGVYLGALERVQKTVPIEQMAVHVPRDIKKQIKKYKNYGIIAVGMDTIALLDFYKKLG